jgi:hypothetical protein
MRRHRWPMMFSGHGVPQVMEARTGDLFFRTDTVGDVPHLYVYHRPPWWRRRLLRQRSTWKAVVP